MNIHEFLEYRMEKTASKRHLIMDAAVDPLMLMVGKKGKSRRAMEMSGGSLQNIAKAYKDPKMSAFEKNLTGANLYRLSPLGMRMKQLSKRKPGFTRRKISRLVRQKLNR